MRAPGVVNSVLVEPLGSKLGSHQPQLGQFQEKHMELTCLNILGEFYSSSGEF